MISLIYKYTFIGLLYMVLHRGEALVECVIESPSIEDIFSGPIVEQLFQTVLNNRVVVQVELVGKHLCAIG